MSHRVNHRRQGIAELGGMLSGQDQWIAQLGRVEIDCGSARLELDRHDMFLLAFGITISGMQQSCHTEGGYPNADAAGVQAAHTQRAPAARLPLARMLIQC